MATFKITTRHPINVQGEYYLCPEYLGYKSESL